jgi:hypothetical protein
MIRRRSFCGIGDVMMEQTMDKRTLDKWGGVGSMSAGVCCIWLAMQHNSHEQMYTVWLITCAVLVLNGIAMLLYSQRPKGTGPQAKR